MRQDGQINPRRGTPDGVHGYAKWVDFFVAKRPLKKKIAETAMK